MTADIPPNVVAIPFMSSDDGLFLFDFYSNNQPVQSAPRCLFTLRSAGDMKFDWDIQNSVREEVFCRAGINPAFVAPVKLIHSQIIYDISLHDPATVQSFLAGREGDGIITNNPSVVPSVTGADCMPVYFYDRVTGVRGVVHSGWKGTGIATVAIQQMMRLYGSKPADICVVLGPHIRDCCYTVDKERADFFAETFGADCVIPQITGNDKHYRLSLLRANITLLENAGIRDIAYTDVCTCCNTAFGSFRRETAGVAGAPFTRGAACVF